MVHEPARQPDAGCSVPQYGVHECCDVSPQPEPMLLSFVHQVPHGPEPAAAYDASV